MKVLIVEDERELNTTLTAYLQKEGYVVESVFDYESAEAEIFYRRHCRYIIL